MNERILYHELVRHITHGNPTLPLSKIKAMANRMIEAAQPKTAMQRAALAAFVAAETATKTKKQGNEK